MRTLQTQQQIHTNLCAKHQQQHGKIAAHTRPQKFTTVKLIKKPITNQLMHTISLTLTMSIN